MQGRPPPGALKMHPSEQRPRPADEHAPSVRSSTSRYADRVAIACVAGVFLVGFVDYATGTQARIFPLYYLPIAWGALRVSRAFGLLLAALSTTLWAVALHIGHVPWSSGLYGFNILMQLASFALIALLMGDIARRLTLERDLSRRDSLTSLPNGRAFYEMAALLLAGARRSGRPMVLAYIDLDNFKTVNDQSGHLEGDAALRVAAEVLRRETRTSDVVARMGGDEFTVLLPETTAEAARIALARLGRNLATAMEQHSWPITASIGAAAFAHAPDSLETAIHRADQVMYRVKSAGKNRVQVDAVDAEDGTTGSGAR